MDVVVQQRVMTSENEVDFNYYNKGTQNFKIIR